MKPMDEHEHEHEHEAEGARFATLVAAEARGEALTSGDAAFRRRYEASHPEAAAEVELWSAIGTLGAARAGMSDAELLARVLQRAAEPAPPGHVSSPAPRLRRRGVAVTFAAVGLAATLMVALAAELHERRSPEPARPPVTGSVATATTGEALPAPPVTTEVPALPVTTEAPAPPVTTEAPAPRPAVTAPSADELLRRAQDHLGAGRPAAALEAYRELVARYPASAEGRAAQLSLGRLALDEGHAEEALGHLDRYLLRPGPLDEEARYWRIEALRRLGRSAAEAAAVEDFLARHPASVHAERLRAQVPSVATTPK